MPAKKDAPKLAEWTTLSDLAARLGVTKQAVNAWARDGWITTLHWVSTGEGRRPLWMLAESEVARLAVPGNRRPVSPADNHRAGEEGP